MLCLKNSTNRGWINSALADLGSVILDHAHCEKKAAATGLSLISSYPESRDISLAMSDLVEEEIGHYRAVIKLMESRDIPQGKDKGDPYVKQLLSNLRHNEPERMLDRLLTAGIIEARSCERLQILAAGIKDLQLQEFYKNLASTEAGHYVTFIKLAKLYFDEEKVKKRLDELCTIEAEIVSSLKNEPYMHG